MKLQDGPLVKWRDPDNGWQTGCLLVNATGEVCTMRGWCVKSRLESTDLVHVQGTFYERHLVEWSSLTERPNEHPE